MTRRFLAQRHLIVIVAVLAVQGAGAAAGPLPPVSVTVPSHPVWLPLIMK